MVDRRITSLSALERPLSVRPARLTLDNPELGQVKASDHATHLIETIHHDQVT